MKNDFYKTRSDRKYASIVDEYRRYYVTGKNFKIKDARHKNMGDKIFQIVVKEMLRSLKTLKSNKGIVYDELFSKMKLGSSKYKKNIVLADFKKDRRIILQYEDDKKNIYRIVIESKSNSSNKIDYSEWVKKDKSFFGMSDTLGKIFMRRGVVKRSKLLKDKVNNILFGIKIKTVSENTDSNKVVVHSTKGFLNRKELSYKNDLAGRHDKNAKAPDELWADQELEKNLKEMENKK